jgi:hypothetical protein
MMKIRNEVQEAVTSEVLRLKSIGETHNSPCWCPLCEADVAALSMSILPPRYSTTVFGDITTDGNGSNPVRSALSTSLRRVDRSPNHPRSSPEGPLRKMRVINFAYEEGAALVSSLIAREDLPCDCDDCLADTLAYSLNRYPPKYGVIRGGRSNLPAYQRDFMRHELNVIISHAVNVIASAPRHGQPRAV